MSDTNRPTKVTLRGVTIIHVAEITAEGHAPTDAIISAMINAQKDLGYKILDTIKEGFLAWLARRPQIIATIFGMSSDANNEKKE